MVDQEELKKHRETVQKIIDKYLPEDKKFSVEDFNKEQLWYVCRLLLEKDDEKRKNIREEIKGKLNNAKHEYEKQYYDIMKNKEIFDSYSNFTRDADDLINDVEVENEMDARLDKI